VDIFKKSLYFLCGEKIYLMPSLSMLNSSIT
jgi:hypothetical protein